MVPELGFLILFTFGCAGSLSLCRLSVVVANRDHSLVVEWLLIVVACLVVEHGL